VNREQLRELGFELGASAGGESQGAWFATAPDGSRVVLKWFRDETVVERYAVLLPALDQLRARGVPVPVYAYVGAVDGWTVAAQEVLPGRSFATAPPHLVDRMIECVDAAAGIGGPLPAPDLQPWGEFLVHSLTAGENGWAQHDSLRAHSDETRRIIDIVESIGADAEPSWFPTTGLVHLDLHTDNVLALDDGTLSGIIDWEGACAGDHRFDLFAYAFDLDGHGHQIWDRVEPLIEPHVIRAYAAHMVLRQTDWAIRHHPDDVRRQLDRADRILTRYRG
jgi:aminoglycoside phosphotransferase (APT) family kinase protein